MKKMILILVPLGLLTCILAYVMHVSSSRAVYMITDLGTLGGGTSHATDINNNGQIIGYSHNEALDNHERAFMWERGVMKELGSMGYERSEAASINDKGQIVGRVYDRKYGGEVVGHGFIWQDGRMTGLGKLDGHPAIPHAVNNRDQVVGSLDENRDDSLGFIRENGKTRRFDAVGGKYLLPVGISDNGHVIANLALHVSDGLISRSYIVRNGGHTELTVSGAESVSVRAINNRGEVVGAAGGPWFRIGKAFLWRNGKSLLLGSLRGDRGGATPWDISNDGVVVGSSEVSGRPPSYAGYESRVTRYFVEAFIWEKGEIRNLNDLIPAHSGWYLCLATAINDRGQIVGNGLRGRESHAFLLTPIHRVGRSERQSSSCLWGLTGAIVNVIEISSQ